MRTSQTPAQTRSQDVEFVATCSFAGLRARLPLVWPTPPETPPSPKKQYRSSYTHPGYEKLSELETWKTLPLFEILLHLVDFSGLVLVNKGFRVYIDASAQDFDQIAMRAGERGSGVCRWCWRQRISSSSPERKWR